ncbi:MAG: SDR family oxidoreductase [Nitrospiria bacterium]
MQKTAMITGGAKRLGYHMALLLAGDGFDIALHCNTSLKEAETTRHAIETRGRRCLLLPGDLTDAAIYDTLIDTACEKLGPLSVLINNASVFEKSDFARVSPADFDQNIQLHLKAPFFLSQAFAKQCEKGAIINMLDTRVENHDTAYFAYTLSKKALKELTLMSAKTLAPKIRVNGVCPGAILPPENTGEETLHIVAGKTPMKRPGGVHDILNAVRYLTQSDYVTGEILYVDGGARLQ